MTKILKKSLNSAATFETSNRLNLLHLHWYLLPVFRLKAPIITLGITNVFTFTFPSDSKYSKDHYSSQIPFISQSRNRTLDQ